jgi:anti-sigma factor RsiW
MIELPDDMTCREVVELVSDYLEGALPPDTAARFERHLRTCDGCMRYVEQMRLTIGAVGRLRDETVPPQALERLVATFEGWRRSSGQA